MAQPLVVPPSSRLRPLLAATGRALASPPALITLGFAALYLATFDSEMGSPDETQRYRLGLALAERGLGALKGSGALSRYPPLQSLLAAPLMKIGLALDQGQDGLWTHRLALCVSLVTCAALVPMFYVVARRLDVRTWNAALATALFGITNPVWPYSKRFFSEPLSAALALGAFAGALSYTRTGRKLALIAGLVCFTILPLNNLILPVAVGPAVALLLLLEKRRRALVGLGIAALLGVSLLAASSWLRFGSLFDSGYGTERFWFHVVDGLHGLLFGWGRSIFIYAPLIVLSLLGVPALARRSKGTAIAMVIGLGVVLLLAASWWCWWGGICWGPRLVLPILPVASVGVGPWLAEPRRWKAPLAVAVALAGLYVQVMGFAFRHDFDIYFWMSGDYHDERKAWFEWEHSSVRRMPRHFREHPWDLSSSFLTLGPTGASAVEIGRRPVRRVEIVHRGDALIFNWTISDLFAVLQGPDGSRRVPAEQLGARLETFNGQSGSGALDGNPATRWSTGSKRLDGMWVRLELDRVRDDVVRLELEHRPWDNDFPNALSARIQADGPAWIEVATHAATPRLEWNPIVIVVIASGAALGLTGLRRAAAFREGCR